MTKPATSHKARITDNWQAYPNTILQSAHWQGNYPFQYLSNCARARLADIGKRVCGEYDVRMHPLVFRILEAYLAVTSQHIEFRGGKFTSPKAMMGFLGALYSERLVLATYVTRNKWARSWRLMLREVLPDLEAGIPVVRSRAYSAWCKSASLQFEQRVLDPAQVDLWRGWGMNNREGKARWYDFRKLYLRYGKDFVVAFVGKCALYRKNRVEVSISLIQEFSDFLAALPPETTPDTFKSASEMSTLLGKFLRAQVAQADEEEARYAQLYAEWNDFSRLFAEFLSRNGPFAKGTLIPSMPSPGGGAAETHRKVTSDGATVIVKLLTDVPLHLSGEAATRLVFSQVSNDIDSVRKWAAREVEATRLRFLRRKELARTGVVANYGSYTNDDKDKLTYENINWEANACATFEHYGFFPSREGHIASLYPSPLGDIARETLALPTTGTLVPYMTLLVIAHPILTAGFFASLELYDPSEQLSGVAETDIGWVLDGDKLRKGPSTAEQQIHLSENDAELIAQVIELTQPLRNYLKSKGDPSWRKLFLNCGRGFSYPMPALAVGHISYLKNSGFLRSSFLRDGLMSIQDGVRLSNRFTLATLRASVSVQQYIREPNVRKLAEILGHEKFDMKLIRRYLPPPLLKFFQTRWIRLFQCGLLVQALGSEPYTLSATGFTTMDELAEFISNHALKWRPREGVGKEEGNRFQHLDDEVVLSISVPTLTILESLRRTVAERQCAHTSLLAQRWHDYAVNLFYYIENSVPPRDDYVEMLSEARERASSSLIKAEALDA